MRGQLWPTTFMSDESRPPSGDLSVIRLTASLVVLIAGALVLGAVPLQAAVFRLGGVGTALMMVGILAGSIVFFRAFERLKPSTPPTPRRDLAIIVFASLLLGLWIFLFTNALVTILVIGAIGGLILLPEGWPELVSDRLARLSRRA